MKKVGNVWNANLNTLDIWANPLFILRGYYASLFARVRTYTWFEPENCSLGANFQLGELLETRPKGERKSWKIEENMENVERDQILRRKTNDD